MRLRGHPPLLTGANAPSRAMPSQQQQQQQQQRQQQQRPASQTFDNRQLAAITQAPMFAPYKAPPPNSSSSAESFGAPHEQQDWRSQSTRGAAARIVGLNRFVERSPAPLPAATPPSPQSLADHWAQSASGSRQPSQQQQQQQPQQQQQQPQQRQHQQRIPNRVVPKGEIYGSFAEALRKSTAASTEQWSTYLRTNRLLDIVRIFAFCIYLVDVCNFPPFFLLLCRILVIKMLMELLYRVNHIIISKWYVYTQLSCVCVVVVKNYAR
jgi:hypothetical protein